MSYLTTTFRGNTPAQRPKPSSSRSSDKWRKCHISSLFRFMFVCQGYCFFGVVVLKSDLISRRIGNQERQVGFLRNSASPGLEPHREDRAEDLQVNFKEYVSILSLAILTHEF
ncbi:hypothetical protein JTE90_003947 [Oedothorax gibbosus]|uniref:Uncharacterized protein n=1 Tax=Oedothorax gibbosus TaxID=931172 RepID=A0AAV6UWJ2_9ARAC|nr:hypothetical protein JTE90_003947 [Oedothorax gibbosus]